MPSWKDWGNKCSSHNEPPVYIGRLSTLEHIYGAINISSASSTSQGFLYHVCVCETNLGSIRVGDWRSLQNHRARKGEHLQLLQLHGQRRRARNGVDDHAGVRVSMALVPCGKISGFHAHAYARACELSRGTDALQLAAHARAYACAWKPLISPYGTCLYKNRFAPLHESPHTAEGRASTAKSSLQHVNWIMTKV